MDRISEDLHVTCQKDMKWLIFESKVPHILCEHLNH